MVMRVEEEEEGGNWSELPYHVLHEIMEKFSGFTSDYISCGHVCVSWRTAFNDHHHNNPCIFPLLMVPSSFSTSTFSSSPGNIFDQDAENKNKNISNENIFNQKQSVRRFYNISNEKVDDILKVRMLDYSQCLGSSYGWLITVDDVNCLHVRLFHPFFSSSMMSSSSSSPEGIVLPTLEKYETLRKAVLSEDPISNPTGYIVMIIYGGSSNLAFHKSGDKGWTRIESQSIKDSKYGFFDDVIYYQNKFFAIHVQGTVVVCDDLAAGTAARVLLEPPDNNKIMKMYLVESSSGDLLQVHRNVFAAMSNGRFIYSTKGFRVFKLLIHNHSTKAQKIAISTLEPSDYKWVEVKNLCGDTLFLGKNASISIPTSSKYDYTGCKPKPNSIYYTDDSGFYTSPHPNDGPHDIGMFNLEDDTFETYFSTDLNKPVPIWPVPIWIQLDTSSQAYQAYKRRISTQQPCDVQYRFNI